MSEEKKVFKWGDIKPTREYPEGKVFIVSIKDMAGEVIYATDDGEGVKTWTAASNSVVGKNLLHALSKGALPLECMFVRKKSGAGNEYVKIEDVPE